MYTYLIAFIIQSIAIAMGFGLAFLNSKYRVVDLFDMHDMGLNNLYTWIILMGIVGAGINIYLYHEQKIILIISIVLIVLFLIGYWYLFMRH